MENKKDLKALSELIKSRIQSASQKKVGGVQNFWQERFAAYLDKFRWDTDKLESQMKAFWIAVTKHYKSYPSGHTERVLDWGVRNNAHIMQVVKTLNKKK